MDIKQLIGETTDYDKKVALEIKKPKSWCKSVSAFANCYGGKLVFGVANDDALVGLSDAEGDAEKISEIIKTHLNPIPEFKLSFEKDNDKTFVIVEVMKGQQTPYYYEGDGQLIAFMRIGNESVPATPSQLRELVLRGSGESYDSLKSRYDFSDMSFTKLKSVYKKRTGNTFEDTDYESFGLVDENQTVSDFDMINTASELNWTFRSQLTKFIKRFWNDPHRQEDVVWMQKLVSEKEIKVKSKIQALRKML